MATKEKKGAKFGRHARNPSSKLQKNRTAANKARRARNNPLACKQPHDHAGLHAPRADKPLIESWKAFCIRHR